MLDTLFGLLFFVGLVLFWRYRLTDQRKRNLSLLLIIITLVFIIFFRDNSKEEQRKKEHQSAFQVEHVNVF